MWTTAGVSRRRSYPGSAAGPADLARVASDKRKTALRGRVVAFMVAPSVRAADADVYSVLPAARLTSRLSETGVLHHASHFALAVEREVSCSACPHPGGRMRPASAR